MDETYKSSIDGLSQYAGDSATSGDTGADKVKALLAKLSDRPNIHNGTAIDRGIAPVSQLSDKDLEDAGFVPSYVAVPERGQSQLKTYRHPYSNAHFHRHGKYWMYHVDKYPSLAMQILRKRLDAKRGIDTKVNYMEGASHVLREGVPGYVDVVDNAILGAPALGRKEKRTFLSRLLRSAAGVGAATAGLSLLTAALSKDHNPHIATNAASVLAFLAAHKIAGNAIGEGTEAGNNERRDNTWTDMALLGVAPIAAAAVPHVVRSTINSAM